MIPTVNRRDLLRSLAAAALAAVAGPPLLTTAGGPGPLTSRLRAKLRERATLYMAAVQMAFMGLLPLAAHYELLLGSGDAERDEFWAAVRAATVSFDRWEPGWTVLDRARLNRWVSKRMDVALRERKRRPQGRGFLDSIVAKAWLP